MIGANYNKLYSLINASTIASDFFFSNTRFLILIIIQDGITMTHQSRFNDTYLSIFIKWENIVWIKIHWMYPILRVFNMRLTFRKVSRNAYIFKRTGFIYIENVASSDWNTWITSSFEFRSTNLHHSSMGKIVRWKIFLTFAWSFRTAWSMVSIIRT